MFGSAFVSIYGKASIMRFVSDSLKSGQFQSQSDLATIDAHVVFINDSKHRKRTFIVLLLSVVDNCINSTAWVLRCLFNYSG